MGSRGLKVEPTNRKRLLLAVLALLILITVTFPLIAEAAPASSTPNIQPSATASPTEPATTPSPTPLASEITIQKESNSKWWIVYPDGKKVAFESVATYRFAEPTTDEESSAFWNFEVVDNNGNKLPVEFKESVQYMRSKGLWETADRDKAEKDWWDKITGFFDEILDGIKTIITHIQYFERALATRQGLSMIFASIVRLIGSGIGDLIINTIDLVDSADILFQTPVGQVLTGFSQHFGFMLWIIGFFIATAEIAINMKSNQSVGDSIHDYGMNVFKSYLAVIMFTKIPLPLYVFISKIAEKICIPIINMGLEHINSISFNDITWSNTPSNFMLLILFIAMLFSGLKVLFSFVKRGGILMILILVGSVHMINLPRGYWDAFWSWCRQIIGLCITQFCQMALFCAGISIIFSTYMVSFAQFLAGLSLTLAAAEVPKIAERYGMDTSLKGNATGAIQSVAIAARMFILKS